MNYVVLDFEVKDKSNLVEDGVFKKIYKRDFGFEGIKLNQVITENILSIKLLDLEKNQVIRITEKDKTMIDNFFEKGWEWYNYLGITRLRYNRGYRNCVIIRRLDKLPNIYIGYGKERNVYLLTDHGEEGLYVSSEICKEVIEDNKELFKTVPCYYMEVNKLQQVFGLNLYKDNLKAKLLGKANISFRCFDIEVEKDKLTIFLYCMFLKECEDQGRKQLEESINAQVNNRMSLEDVGYGDAFIDDVDLVTCDMTIAIEKEFIDRFFSKSNVYDAYRHYEESIDSLIEFK